MQKHSLTFKVSAAQQVKDEFKEKRDFLQSIGAISLEQFIEFAQANNSVYDSPEGFSHLRNIYYGRTADLNAVRIIEKYQEQQNR